MKRNNIKKYVFLFLMIINCITIFCFSGQEGNTSGKTSTNVVEIISNIIPSIREMDEVDKVNFQEQILSPIIRKVAHFSIYALLGFLTISYALNCRGTLHQKVLSSTIFGILYAISDEIHQLFIEGRACLFYDVYIDTLGVLTGIVFALIIVKIIKMIIHKDEEERNIDKETSILFISSTGGHFSELMQLTPIISKCNYHIVTEKTETNYNLKEKYNKKIDFLIYGTKKNKIKYPFILLLNSFISLYIYLRKRPEIIITTGTHTAGPMCCIGKLLGSKVIYIETFANSTTKTVTGAILYHLADVFVVQWEEMLKIYPKAEYWGWIY